MKNTNKRDQLKSVGLSEIFGHFKKIQCNRTGIFI